MQRQRCSNGGIYQAKPPDTKLAGASAWDDQRDESHESSSPADLTNSTTRGRQRSQTANTHCSWKVRTSIHVVSGKFSLSLYVGKITEYFFLLVADGVAPVCDLVTTILLCTARSTACSRSLFDRDSPGYSPVKTPYIKVWKPNFDFATSPRARETSTCQYLHWKVPTAPSLQHTTSSGSRGVSSCNIHTEKAVQTSTTYL